MNEDLITIDYIQTSDVIITEAVATDVPLTILEREICELWATGSSEKKIAIHLGVPEKTVKALFAKKGVRAFLNDLIEHTSLSVKAESFRVMNATIAAKVDEVTDEETGEINYAELTNKDVVDLYKVMADIEKGTKDTDTEGNLYLTILQQMSNK